MEQGDPEHEAGDEADGHLEACMSELDDQREPASGEGGEQHQCAVGEQQPPGRNHAGSDNLSNNRTPVGRFCVLTKEKTPRSARGVFYSRWRKWVQTASSASQSP